MDYIFSIQKESSNIFNEKRKNIPMSFNKKRVLISNTYTFIYSLNYQTHKYRYQNHRRKSLKNLHYY